jgi:hypothetical protein
VQDLRVFLARARELADQRNELVHSLWPAQPGGRLFGWRPSRDPSISDATPIATTLEHDELLRRIGAVVSLLNAVGPLLARIHGGRRV